MYSFQINILFSNKHSVYVVVIGLTDLECLEWIEDVSRFTSLLNLRTTLEDTFELWVWKVR